MIYIRDGDRDLYDDFMDILQQTGDLRIKDEM